MLWEHPWETRITKAAGRVVAFETQLPSSETYGVRATWVFFQALPDVILCNTRSIQNIPEGQPLAPTVARFQAYAQADLQMYNGVRLWASDPDGVRLDGAPHREHLDVVEPKYGFFFGDKPAWYYTTVTVGLVAAQFNGYNDWTRNPPCGFIVRAGDYDAAWTSGGPGGYFSEVVQVRQPAVPRGPDDLDHQVLWFEGAGLKCWANVLNLAKAFSAPCEPLLDLTGEGPGTLLAWEREGLRRNAEVVVLREAYGALNSEREWYGGDVCVTLLRDVPAHGEVRLGAIPVTLRPGGEGATIANEAAELRDLWVRMPGMGVRRVALNGKPAEQTVAADDWIAFRCDLGPGETVVQYVYE
jgi:hypothetical protein